MAVTRRTFPLPAFAVLLAAAAAARVAGSDPRPDYLLAVREELARLDLGAVCDELTATCTFAHHGRDGAAFQVGVRHGAATETVYIYIERFLVLDDPDGPSAALARRLLELNRRLVTGKFEWEPESNTVRLTAVLSCDSNFDRKAFRSVVRGLLAAAERLRPELTSLAAP